MLFNRRRFFNKLIISFINQIIIKTIRIIEKIVILFIEIKKTFNLIIIRNNNINKMLIMFLRNQ